MLRGASVSESRAMRVNQVELEDKGYSGGGGVLSNNAVRGNLCAYMECMQHALLSFFLINELPHLFSLNHTARCIANAAQCSQCFLFDQDHQKLVLCWGEWTGWGSAACFFHVKGVSTVTFPGPGGSQYFIWNSNIIYVYILYHTFYLFYSI